MITELVKILAQFDDQASPGIKNLQGATSEFLTGLAAGAATAAAAFLSVQAVFQGFADSIARADALDDLSEKTGIATEKLGELSYAARVAGGKDVGDLASAFRFLTRSMSKTGEESSKQAEAFAEIGVSATDATGNLRATDEVFGDIADKFQTLENGPEKAALALKLFGGAGTELIPILNKGREGIAELKREAEQLGLIIPAEQAAAAGEFGDNLERVTSIAEGLFNTLSGALLPALNAMLNEIVSSAKEGGILRDVLNGIGVVFQSIVVPAVKLGAAVFNGFLATLKLIGKTLGAVAAGVVALMSGDFNGAKAAVSGLGDDFKQVADDVATFQAKLFETPKAATAVDEGTKRTSTSLKKVGKAAKEAKSELEALVNQLKVSNDTFGLTDEQIAQYEAAAKYLKDINAGVPKDRARALYEEATALISVNAELKRNAEARKQSEKEAEAARKAAEDDAKRAAQELESLVSGTSQAIFDSVSRNIAILDQALQDGKIKSEQYYEAVGIQFERLKDKSKVTAEESVLFWEEAAKGIQGNLQTFFFDALQGNFSDLGDAIKKTIDNIIAQMLAAQVAAALFGNSFGQKGGQLGGFVGQGVNFLSGLFGGARASGGDVQAGRAYIVGERGPEPFIPKVNGTILPNASLQGGGSTMHVTVSAIDSKDFLTKMAEVKREMADMMNNTNRSYRLKGAY